MESIVLVIHLMVALAIIAVVLLQRSEGGGLGVGGSGGGMGGLATPRTTADFLTRLTGVLATIFMITSLLLAILSGNGQASTSSILDAEAPTEVTAPISAVDDVKAMEEKTMGDETAVEKPVKAPVSKDATPVAPISE